MSSPSTPTPAQPTWSYSWPEVFRMSYRELVDIMLDTGRPRDLPELARERIDAVAIGSDDVSCVLTAKLTWTSEELQTASDYVVQTAKLDGWDVRLGNASLNHADQQLLAGLLDIKDALPPNAWSINCNPLRRTLPAGSKNGLDWPMPQHTTCWGYEDAARLLNEAEARWQQQPAPRFGAWVDAMTEVIEGALRVKADATWDPSWPSLTARLEKLTEEPLGRRWRIEVLALCVPEMGMTALDSLALKVRSDERAQAQEIRDRRDASSSKYRELRSGWELS